MRRHTLRRDSIYHRTVSGRRRFVGSAAKRFSSTCIVDLFGRVGGRLRIPVRTGCRTCRTDRRNRCFSEMMKIAQNFRIDGLFIIAVPRCGNHAAGRTRAMPWRPRMQHEHKKVTTTRVIFRFYGLSFSFTETILTDTNSNREDPQRPPAESADENGTRSFSARRTEMR